MKAKMHVNFENEVIAIDGQPAVRPMLPLVFIFDHRLFDGVMCTRILSRLGEILQAPQEYFGQDGAKAVTGELEL